MGSATNKPPATAGVPKMLVWRETGALSNPNQAPGHEHLDHDRSISSWPVRCGAADAGALKSGPRAAGGKLWGRDGDKGIP